MGWPLPCQGTGTRRALLSSRIALLRFVIGQEVSSCPPDSLHRLSIIPLHCLPIFHQMSDLATSSPPCGRVLLILLVRYGHGARLTVSSLLGYGACWLKSPGSVAVSDIIAALWLPASLARVCPLWLFAWHSRACRCLSFSVSESFCPGPFVALPKPNT